MLTKQELIDKIQLAIVQCNELLKDNDFNTAEDSRESNLKILNLLTDLVNNLVITSESSYLATVSKEAGDKDLTIDSTDPKNPKLSVRGASYFSPIVLTGDIVIEENNRNAIGDPESLGNNISITLPNTSGLPTDFFLVVYNISVNPGNLITVKGTSGNTLFQVNAQDNYLIYYTDAWKYLKINSLPVSDNTILGDFTPDSLGRVNFSEVATASQGDKADSALQSNDNVSELQNDKNYAVKGQILKEDIADFSDSDYANSTEGERADSALQPGDNISELNNDANFVEQSALNSALDKIDNNNDEIQDLLNGKVASVSGDGVNNSSPLNPVIRFPGSDEIIEGTNKFVTQAILDFIGAQSGENTGDETTESIKTKRPIKSLGGESLEGTGNIDLPASGVVSVSGNAVDNTDPDNPVVTAATEEQGELADTALQPVDIVDFPDLATVEAIAAGSSLGVEQALLANDGQPGFTVQAVGYTNTGKVQGCSLGAGNVVEVYADGNDFNAGNVLYREFMALGEPICFTGLTNGAIITASEGFYGFSEGLNGGNESPMPLLSYGLSFKFSFFYMFRDSQSFSPGGTNSSQGWIHVVNGPLASVVSLKFGDESVVEGQENISLAPWQYYRFYSSGNVEYILDSTNPIMACVNARMGPDPRFYDSRLVMPLANAIFSWPRSGNVSAPYEGTISPWYNRTGTSGELNSAGTVGNGPGVSPGFPVDWDSPPPVGTGASDQDYEANGFTAQYFVGLGCAYSGADSAGLEASPAIPKAAMSQIVAQPLYIKDNGDGGNSGVAIGSYYEGTAKIYAWDFVTKTLNLAYTVPLTRGNTVPAITSKEDQLIPASGLVANETGSGAVLLEGDLAAGVVIADVPITVVTQNGDNAYVQPIRSQNGTETTSLVNDDDETLSLGITPESIRVEVREGEDGILYKRTIAAGGIETWVVA